MSEKELSIQVTEINSIEIDNVDFAEAGKDEVFQKLAADAASANQEDARLRIEGRNRQYPITVYSSLISSALSIIQRDIPP